MLSWNGIDVYHQIRECRPALPSKPYVGAATGENNLHIGANRTHQRGDSISMNSLLSGAVGEDIRYESRTSIACAMVSEGVTRARAYVPLTRSNYHCEGPYSISSAPLYFRPSSGILPCAQ